MRAYSVDLRERIVAAAKTGHSLRTVAQQFSVSAASVSRYIQQQKQRQTLAPKLPPGAKQRLSGEVLAALLCQVEQHPDQTVTELHQWLQMVHPATRVSRATVHRALVRAGITYKKSRWSPVNAMR